jgi:hypothetical protein
LRRWSRQSRLLLARRFVRKPGREAPQSNREHVADPASNKLALLPTGAAVKADVAIITRNSFARVGRKLNTISIRSRDIPRNAPST